MNIIQLLGFLTESGAELLDRILAHIGTSACCDLLLKLILNLEGPDMKANLLDVSLFCTFALLLHLVYTLCKPFHCICLLFQWLLKEDFLDRLTKKMELDETRVHEGVHRLVVDLLAAFRDDWSSNADSNVLFLALRRYHAEFNHSHHPNKHSAN